MPEEVYAGYKHAEDTLRRFMKSDRKAARKLLSAYMNLLTVYPDQPYGQPEIVHPINGSVVVMPKSIGDFNSILPKEEKTLEIVRAKVATGERVLIYTSWTRTDSQRKLQGLLNQEGIHTDILAPTISPEKREAWVEQRVNSGLQVLITNPKCVETGLDLNAFTTLIFYSMGYNLFTLRQASHRSWRINQTAPRVEVYMLYYADTMQAKAMKLMASKLAVAGLVEGSFSEEGLAAMSDVRDMTSQMAKELAQGIKDNVEDIAAAFKKMAVINPERRARAAAPPAPELPTPKAAARERRQQITLPAAERKPVMICRVTISWRRKEIMQMLRDEMLAVIADVNTQVAERDELVECIAIALLTRKNLFVLGAPGQAKSCAINAFRSRRSPARGSLSGCCQSKPMRNSSSAGSTWSACSPAALPKRCWTTIRSTARCTAA